MALLHNNFKRYIMKTVMNSLINSDNLYFFIGHVLPWTDENTPETVTGSAEYLQAVRDSMIACKKVSVVEDTNLTFVIPRYDWDYTSTTVYTKYSASVSDLNTDSNKPHHVLYYSSYYNNYYIFKCLENGGDTNPATVTPNPSNFTSTNDWTCSHADGYTWKLMCRLSSNQRANFLNEDWIPVKLATSDDLDWAYQEQYQIQEAATIHGVNVLDELGAQHIMITTVMHNLEGGSDFPSSNNYRTVGLITNLKTISGIDAIADTLRGTKKLHLSNVSGSFPEDNLITTYTGAQGYVVQYDSIIKDLFVLPTEIQTFVVGDITSEAGGDALVTSVTNEEFDRNSGDILYIYNRIAVTRSIEQSENVKVVIKI